MGTALERRLSDQVMRGGHKPRIRKLASGTTLVYESETGSEVFLLLDGVLRVGRGGERLAEYGLGATRPLTSSERALDLTQG